jgi:hypothetical protein
MAKLLSHHDKFHIHGILGLTALAHFIYRFLYLFVHMEESFCPGIESAVLLGVHILLHITSFQFMLPRHRINTKPMIWTEFRVHSAIFAYRNLVTTYLGIWFPVFWWREPTAFSVVLKVAVLFATCKAADIATARFGSKDHRTTNAMPYPGGASPALIGTAKWFYAKSQFAAAALAVFGTPSLSFLSVFAIEIAAFLMTLVRKGIIEAHTYHGIYGVSLFIMFPAIVATFHGTDTSTVVPIFRALTACFVVCVMRLEHRIDKYICWATAVVVGSILAPLVPSWIIPWIVWVGMIWSAADTLNRLVNATAHGSKQLSLVGLIQRAWQAVYSSPA